MTIKEKFLEEYRDAPTAEIDSIISGLLFNKRPDDHPLLSALTEIIDRRVLADQEE